MAFNWKGMSFHQNTHMVQNAGYIYFRPEIPLKQDSISWILNTYLDLISLHLTLFSIFYITLKKKLRLIFHNVAQKQWCSPCDKTQACIACKSYFFGRVGWDGTLCIPNVFIFVTGKEHNFQKNQKILHYFTIRERKNNLIYLNSHR